MSSGALATISTVLEYAVWAIAFWLPIFAAGHVSAALLFRSAGMPARRWLFLSLGMLCWMALVFTLAATRRLDPTPLIGAAVVALAARAFLLFREYHAGWRPDWRLPSRPPLEEWLPWLPVIAVLAMLFLQTILPVVSHDAQVYHLQVPKTMLQSHRFRPLSFNVYSHWPMNIEQLFTLAMAWKDYRLAKTVHYAFGLFTLLIMAAFCRRQARPIASPMTAIFFLMNGVVRQEMTIAYIDLGSAFFFFLAFWFVVERLLHPENGSRPLLAAGLLIGILAGTKFHAFVGGVCLGLLFLIASRREGKPWRRLKEMLWYMALPGFLLLLPWLIKNAVETGNPVYPFFYSSLGGIEWNDRLSDLFYRWHHDAIGMGRTGRDYLLLPWRVITGGAPGLSKFGGVTNDLWLLLLPLTWFGRRLPAVRWSLLAALFYFIFWMFSSQQTRFLIPLLPFLAVAAALSLAELAARLPWPSWKRPLAVAIAVAAGAWLLYGVAALPAAVGLTTGRYNKLLHRDPREKAIRCLNEKLPPKARVLVLQQNRCFFIDRKCIADSFYAASQIDELIMKPGSLKDMKKRLRRQGITHLLQGDRRWALRYPPGFEQMLADPAQARLVCHDKKYKLYRLMADP